MWYDEKQFFVIPHIKLEFDMEILTTLNENGNLIVGAIYRICFEWHPLLGYRFVKEYTLSKQDIVSRFPVMNPVLESGSEF